MVGDHGCDRLGAETDDRGDGAATLGHAVDLRHLHVIVACKGRASQQVRGKDGTLPADAAQQNSSCVGHGLFPFLGRGCDALERAILLALAAADAHAVVDDRMPVLGLGDGRAA